MLSVFYGSDTEVVRTSAFAHAQTFIKNGYELSRIEAHDYQSGKLANVCEGVSLFGAPGVYILDTPSAHSDFWDELVALQDTLAAATEPYIVIEEALTAVVRKQLSASITWHEAKAEAKKRFDTFRLAGALSARDKRLLWITLHEARTAGIANEEIIGILWWQLKTLRLAQVTNSAAEAGIKEFPYRKAKQALLQFNDKELLALMRSLLVVYHDGHGGERDLSLALEQWILNEV